MSVTTEAGAREVVGDVHAKPRSKTRGRRDDTPDVRHSKTLSYILRHGAAREGLKMRSDGFVRVDELVSACAVRARQARC